MLLPCGPREEKWANPNAGSVKRAHQPELCEVRSFKYEYSTGQRGWSMRTMPSRRESVTPFRPVPDQAPVTSRSFIFNLTVTVCRVMWLEPI